MPDMTTMLTLCVFEKRFNLNMFFFQYSESCVVEYLEEKFDFFETKYFKILWKKEYGLPMLT